MDVNHPHLGHPVRGRRRGLGAQGGQLAVSGLLPVQGRVIDGVRRAGTPVRAGGADGRPVKSGHAVFWTLQPRVRVRPVGSSHAHPSLLEKVRVRIQPLVSPSQTVTFTPQVLVRLDVPPLQDGTGTGRNGAGRGVGVRQSVPGHGGAARDGALPGAERDARGGWRHGVWIRGERSLQGMVCWGTHGGLSQGIHHVIVHLEKQTSVRLNRITPTHTQKAGEPSAPSADFVCIRSGTQLPFKQKYSSYSDYTAAFHRKRHSQRILRGQKIATFKATICMQHSVKVLRATQQVQREKQYEMFIEEKKRRFLISVRSIVPI